MKVVFESQFDNFHNKLKVGEENKSEVFQIFPDYYGDDRGYFMEVVKDHGQWPYKDLPLWMSCVSWIRQINRSSSASGVIRGCHAQKGVFCQGKLVEAINRTVYDIITDARPDSDSFGASSIYILSPKIHNQLWVPRGFLHSFIVPFENKEFGEIKDGSALFQYFVDNSYKKESEFGVNPITILPKIVKHHKKVFEELNEEKKLYEPLYEMFEEENRDKLILSKKDMNNEDYETFMERIKKEYAEQNNLWYVK